MTRHPRLTYTQKLAMWAVYRAGHLTTLNQWKYVTDYGRIRTQSIRSLGVGGPELVCYEEYPSLRVTAPDGRVYTSTIQWSAELTQEGQEWIARQMVEIEGLPDPPPRATV